MSEPSTNQTTAIGLPTAHAVTAAEDPLFGGPPMCAKFPGQRCVPECEYGLAGPCVRERRADALQRLADIDRDDVLP